MEKISKSKLPIVGSHEFELSEGDVRRAFKDAQDNLRETEEALGDSDERLRNFAERSISGVRERVQALSASPKEVLSRVKTFYDRTAELGSSGMDEDKLALQLGDEFPDLTDFYGLLRMKPWGYRLAQNVTAAQLDRQMRRGK